LLLRQDVRHIVILEEAPIRRFGHAITEFVAELGAIRLALLAQFLQPFGVSNKRSTVSVGSDLPQAVNIPASRTSMVLFMARFPLKYSS